MMTNEISVCQSQPVRMAFLSSNQRMPGPRGTLRRNTGRPVQQNSNDQRPTFQMHKAPIAERHQSVKLIRSQTVILSEAKNPCSFQAAETLNLSSHNSSPSFASRSSYDQRSSSWAKRS